MKNWQGFVAAVVGEVKSYVAERLRPLERSIGELDGRLKALPPPKDGAPGKDGSSVTLADVEPLVEKAVRALPLAREIKSITAEDLRPMLSELVAALPAAPSGEKGDAGERGEPGKDGVPGPAGDRGPPGKDGAAGERGEKGDAGSDGARGVDGHSVTVDDVRPLLESMHASWALDWERAANDVIQRTLDRMPRPKDGKDGVDGKDAFQLDQFAMTLSDDQTEYVWTFGAGETRKEFRFPRPAYREVYRAGETYRTGDSVTWGGSLWIAMRNTAAKPESDDSWRLAAKRGRDGKNGEKGERGEPGQDGRGIR